MKFRTDYEKLSASSPKSIPFIFYTKVLFSLQFKGLRTVGNSHITSELKEGREENGPERRLEHLYTNLVMKCTFFCISKKKYFLNCGKNLHNIKFTILTI